MGPRLRRRGRSRPCGDVASEDTGLQWGRVCEDAEGESCWLWCGHIGALQWGRVCEDAEGGGSTPAHRPRSTAFNGAASAKTRKEPHAALAADRSDPSMGPRLRRRGRHRSVRCVGGQRLPSMGPRLRRRGRWRCSRTRDGRPAPSMGPRLRRRGRDVDVERRAVACQPSMGPRLRRRGRERVAVPDGRHERCAFNGAASAKTRKAMRPSTTRIGWATFNGAASAKTRKARAQ